MALQGKKVLHVDRLDHYGGSDANMSYQCLVQAATGDYRLHPHIQDIDLIIADEEGHSALLESRDARQISVDLTPRLVFARGDMLQRIVGAGLDQYAEFTLIGEQTVWPEGGQPVPLPFAANNITNKDRYAALKAALAPAPAGGGMAAKLAVLSDLKRFADFRADIREHIRRVHPAAYGAAPLPTSGAAASPELGVDRIASAPTLPDLLSAYSIASPVPTLLVQRGVLFTGASPSSISTADAVAGFVRYYGSYGRYHLPREGGVYSSPLLTVMYGSGDLVQAVCRLCAVRRGVYIVGADVDVTRASDVTVTIQDTVIKATAPVIITEAGPDPFGRVESFHYIAVVRDVVDTEDRQLHAIETAAGAVWGLELGSTAKAAPRPFRTVHLIAETAEARASAAAMLRSRYHVVSAVQYSKVASSAPGEGETCTVYGRDGLFGMDGALGEAGRVLGGMGLEVLPKPKEDE